MRVLIADDHDLLRDTLVLFLQSQPGLEPVAVQDLPEALDKMANDGPFDLVLLDYGMPGMNGLDGLRTALAAPGNARVALMSGTAPREIAEEALALGAAGFLPKTLAAKTLANAVRFMAMGEQYAPVDFMTAAPQDAAPPHPLDRGSDHPRAGGAGRAVQRQIQQGNRPRSGADGTHRQIARQDAVSQDRRRQPHLGRHAGQGCQTVLIGQVASRHCGP